jgi:hypothetical protein
MSKVVSSPADPSDPTGKAESGAEAKNPNRFFLPSPTYHITWSAQKLFRAIAGMFCMFVHAGTVVELAFIGRDRAVLREVTPAMARSRFEAVGELWQDGNDNKGRKVSRPHRCSKDQADALLNTREATEILPPISIVSAAPILTIDHESRSLVLKSGYHHELGGVFVTTNKVKEKVPVKEAVESLLGLIRDYCFQTPEDKARAVAAMITPTLVNGQLLGNAHIPMFLVEANTSQAGKGLLLEIIAAIYGEQPKIVVGRNGGVGSCDEDLNATLLRGCPFILLDNLRGKLDSPHLEAFLTAGGPFPVRTFRRAPTDIDPRRYIVLATSNGFKSTADLDNRMIRIAIYKHVFDYEFELYNEDLLALIADRQSYYLGCVFTIVSQWITEGRQRTEELRHTFRDWAQVVDWILLNIFKDKVKGRLMDYTGTPPGSEPDPLDEVVSEGSEKS